MCLSFLNDPACLVNTMQAFGAQLTSQMTSRRLSSAGLLFQALPLLLVSLHLQFYLPPLLWHQRASASHHLGATCSFPSLSSFLSFCQCSPTVSGGSLPSHRLPLLFLHLSIPALSSLHQPQTSSISGDKNRCRIEMSRVYLKLPEH